MADLLKLAERCEAATGPDRELDREIAFAINLEAGDEYGGKQGWADLCANGKRWADQCGFKYPHLSFTASLDAAMTLEPEGLESEEIYPPDAECPVWTSHIVIRGDFYAGTGSTRVLAQLASRLRARAGEQS